MKMRVFSAVQGQGTNCSLQLLSRVSSLSPSHSLAMRNSYFKHKLLCFVFIIIPPLIRTRKPSNYVVPNNLLSLILSICLVKPVLRNSTVIIVLLLFLYYCYYYYYYYYYFSAEQSILNKIQRRQLKWYGHRLRMKDSPWPKMIYKWIPHGRSRRGRPQQSWKIQVTNFMRSRNLEADMSDRRL